METLTYPSSGTHTTVVSCVECGGLGGSHAVTCSYAPPVAGVTAIAPDALRRVHDALQRAEQTCRYHGADFDRLGREPDGAPRCDSCKQPWRVTRALAAIGGAL